MRALCPRVERQQNTGNGARDNRADRDAHVVSSKRTAGRSTRRVEEHERRHTRQQRAAAYSCCNNGGEAHSLGLVVVGECAVGECVVGECECVWVRA